MALLLEIEGPSSTPTANVKNPPSHISCRLSLPERPVIVLGQIVLRVCLARVYETVVSLDDLNHFVAPVEIVKLMAISVLTILQHITVLQPTDKKKSYGSMSIYPRMRQAWQLVIETGPGWTLDLHYYSLRFTAKDSLPPQRSELTRSS